MKYTIDNNAKILIFSIVLFFLTACSTPDKNSPFMKFERSSDYTELNKEIVNDFDKIDDSKSVFICLAAGKQIVPDALVDDIFAIGIDDKFVSKLKGNNDSVRIRIPISSSVSDVKFYLLQYKLIDKNKLQKYPILSSNRFFIIRPINKTFDKENIASTLAYGLMGYANSVISYKVYATNMDEYKETCNIKHRVIQQKTN